MVSFTKLNASLLACLALAQASNFFPRSINGMAENGLLTREASLSGLGTSPLSMGRMLSKRQYCALPVICNSGDYYNTECCPRDYACCAAGTRKCCPIGSNCRQLSGQTICCSEGAEECGGKTCLKKGSICCGDRAAGCAPEFQCNLNGTTTTCCKAEDTKCENACCPRGSKCGATPGSCEPIPSSSSAALIAASTSLPPPASTISPIPITVGNATATVVPPVSASANGTAAASATATKKSDADKLNIGVSVCLVLGAVAAIWL